jgi:hypothetical protein
MVLMEQVQSGALHMSEEETTRAALAVLRKWIEKYGISESC